MKFYDIIVKSNDLFQLSKNLVKRFGLRKFKKLKMYSNYFDIIAENYLMSYLIYLLDLQIGITEVTS